MKTTIPLSLWRYSLRPGFVFVASPSPRPSPPPRGRGRSVRRSNASSERVDWSRSVRRFSLSPAEGERAGVRGNEIRQPRRIAVLPVLPLKHRSARGAVLLEVILALVLFAAAAAIIGAGIHSAINGVERQKLNAHAVNLAVSVISEIQMGLRTVESVGPESFVSPFDHWTWELALAPAEDEAGEVSELTRVEVIVRHDDPALVHRLTQLLKLEKKQLTTTAAVGNQP